MKYIDLNSDKSRQIIVDKETEQYLAHPVTVLHDNQRTIFVVYPKGHASGELVLKRSDDGGLTWSNRLKVPENWKTSISCPTIHKLCDKTGKSRFVILTGNEGDASVPVRQSISEDGGETWSPLIPIGTPGYGNYVTGSSIIKLKNGDYMSLQHFDYFELYKIISQDGGLTWSTPVQITNFSPKAKLCEPCCLRSPDGNQIAVLIRDFYRKNKSYVMSSDDEGVSWSIPRELPKELTGERAVARYAPDGRLVITFRDVLESRPSWGDWVVWVGTYQDIIDNRPGQYLVRLMDNHGGGDGCDCGYAGLELLPDDTFVLTSYGHWLKGVNPYIVCIRLKLEELDALAAKQ